MPDELDSMKAYLRDSDLDGVTLRRMCKDTGMDYCRAMYVLKQEGTGFKQLLANEFQRRTGSLSKAQLQRIVTTMYELDHVASRWDFFKALREVQHDV